MADAMQDDTPRLSPERLAGLPPSIRRPGYDRADLAVGMAHIGIGAFHRCHQAIFTDDMLERAMGRWGVLGINLHPPRLSETLAPQDGLYTSTLRDGATADTRVIGCLRAVIDVTGAAELAAAVAALASPEIDVVTMTLTEKGYCHVPATGQLDAGNLDLRHDLSGGPPPRTALGLLAQALDRRRWQGEGGVTLISCDNIPSNGAVLRTVLTAFAREVSAPLADWIEGHVTFPSTMVDRIVPATSDSDRTYIRDLTGLCDLGAVVGEPFRQWVIEDRFAARRPAWDSVGATFAEVRPYELIKMRVLNAAQSTLSHLGAIVGHEYSFQAAADPLLARLTRAMLERETATTLPALPGMAVPAYIETTFTRIRNTAIHHRCHQIGTDGSQKIVQRVLSPLRERIGVGLPVNYLSLGAASWIAYVLCGAQRFGGRWQPSDPWAAAIIAKGETLGGDPVGLAKAILSIEAIFGPDLATDAMAVTIGAHLAGLLSADPKAYLAAFQA
jgi:fructuronate reductase